MKADNTEREVAERIAGGDESALADLFRQHYSNLCRTAYRILGAKHQNSAEDIVQEVFLTLWRRHAQLNVQDSLEGYLHRSVVNRALNYLRDRKIITGDDAVDEQLEAPDVSALQQLEAEELESAVVQAIDALPERTRLVFVLSRFELLSQREIAERMSISTKTVENQMSRALRLLRQSLARFLVLYLLVGIMSLTL